MRLTRKRTIIAVVVVCLVPVLLVAASLTALLAENTGSLPARVPAGAPDGLWLGHAWVDGRRTDADLRGLIARLRKTGIGDLFVHVGPLSGDGSLNPARRPRAGWLLAGLHAGLPGVRVQAWLGDLTVPGYLDLASPATRSRVLRSAGQVLAEGFDGVHYDFEPVPDGDPGYLTLLSATHALTRREHKILSIAADQVEPVPGLRFPGDLIFSRPHWWSAGYLSAIGGQVDEIALMTYNTGVPFGAAYSGYVRLQTEIALAALPARVTLLIGLPAYHTAEPGHGQAETVAAAIRGVRLALGARPRRDVGVALYADFSALPADWAAYLTGWSQLRAG